jgi:hypothetical protein
VNLSLLFYKLAGLVKTRHCNKNLKLIDNRGSPHESVSLLFVSLHYCFLSLRHYVSFSLFSSYSVTTDSNTQADQVQIV